VNQRSGEEDNKRKQAVIGRKGYRGGKLSALIRSYSFRGKQADKNISQ
jgi:hypothetical protein